MEVVVVVAAMVEEGVYDLRRGGEEMDVMDIAWIFVFQWPGGLVTWHFPGQWNFEDFVG